MRYLITQSLLASWNYLFEARDEGEDKAFDDFLHTLNREETETTPAMLNGIRFENVVDGIVTGTYQPREEHLDILSGARKVADVLMGAQLQVKLYADASINGMDFLVYGILDGLKAGIIYDVKFSNKSFHSAELAGKYLNSPQHPTYFYLVPEAKEFQYLVSDGEDLYTEIYTPKITTPFEEIVSEFISFLNTAGLLETYKEKWLAK